MTDEEISGMASEPDTISRQREHLEGRKATLEKGQRIFKKLAR
jgi:hypothetical protein